MTGTFWTYRLVEEPPEHSLQHEARTALTVGGLDHPVDIHFQADRLRSQLVLQLVEVQDDGLFQGEGDLLLDEDRSLGAREPAHGVPIDSDPVEYLPAVRHVLHEQEAEQADKHHRKEHCADEQHHPPGVGPPQIKIEPLQPPEIPDGVSYGHEQRFQNLIQPACFMVTVALSTYAGARFNVFRQYARVRLRRRRKTVTRFSSASMDSAILICGRWPQHGRARSL